MPTIGKIKVDLQGDTRQFQRSMRGARRSVDRFGGVMRGLRRQLLLIGGALGFGQLISRTGEEAIRVKQLSDRIGTSVDSFSRLSRVLSRSGIRLDQTGVILQRLQRRAAEAAGGNEQLGAVFEELGINVQDFIKLDPVEAFLRVGTALNGVDNNARKLLLAFKLLDTEGVQVLQTDLGDLRNEIATTSGITAKQAESVTKAAEAWDKLGESFSSAMLTLGQRTGAIEKATTYFEGVQAIAEAPLEKTARNVLASLAGVLPFVGDDLQRRILSRRLGSPQLTRLGDRIEGGNLDFDLLSGRTQPTGQLRGEGLPRLAPSGTIRRTGERQLQGGDLSRTNALLEQIRTNTATPSPAVAQ